MKGMRTCCVCERDFPLLFEDHYVAQDPMKVGAIANLVNNDKAYEYDVIDCPHCGCQNVLQPRKPIFSELISEKDSIKNVPENSCENCKHVNCSSTEEPCILCKHNYVEMWRENDE